MRVAREFLLTQERELSPQSQEEKKQMQKNLSTAKKETGCQTFAQSRAYVPLTQLYCQDLQTSFTGP